MIAPTTNRITQLPEGVLVDDNLDLSQYNKFWVSKRGDVITQSEKRVEGKRIRKTYKLHRIVLGVDGINTEVDHINHNKLDNRISNLRACSHSENGKNLPLKRNNTSGFTGVGYRKDKKKWKATIKHNFKNIHIGYYETIQEAISARLMAESVYFGEFAPNA